MNDSFRIRLARPDEIARLREIEEKAGEMFSGLGLNDDTLDSSFPIDDLIRLVGMEQAWVACAEDDRPVGMVFASVREGAVYVEELDVMPEFGRRGLGLDSSTACATGHGSSDARKSPSQPSAMCRGTGRSTESMASEICSLRSGLRACGRSVSRRRNSDSACTHACSCVELCASIHVRSVRLQADVRIAEGRRDVSRSALRLRDHHCRPVAAPIDVVILPRDVGRSIYGGDSRYRKSSADVALAQVDER